MTLKTNTPAVGGLRAGVVDEIHDDLLEFGQVTQDKAWLPHKERVHQHPGILASSQVKSKPWRTTSLRATSHFWVEHCRYRRSW
jgi:hypothetical protein